MSRRVAAAVMVAALWTGACGSSSKKSSTPTTSAADATTTVAATTTTLASATAIGVAQPAAAIAVAMKGFSFVPDSITAKAGDVSLYISNQEPGAIDDTSYRHDLVIPVLQNGIPEGIVAGSGDFRPTESGTFTVKGLSAGTYTFYCAYHQNTMRGTLTVTS